MRQYGEIGYGADSKKSAYEVRVGQEGRELQIRANRHGMALLASMVADFLLHPDPDSFHYTIDRSQGMKAGCPKLKIQILDRCNAASHLGRNDVIKE